MNKRAVTQGLLIATLASIVSQVLLTGFATWKTELIEIIPHYLIPLAAELIQASRMLAWIVPGLAIGYLCKSKPALHGMLLGLLFGTLLSAMMLTLKLDDLISPSDYAAMALTALTQPIKYALFFTLTAPAGYLFAKYRQSTEPYDQA